MTARSRHTKAAIAEFNDALRGVVEVMVDSKSGNAKDIVQGATELTDEFGERLWLSPALQDRPWLFEAAPVFSMNYERIKGLLAKLLQAMLDARQHRSAVVEDSGGQLSAECTSSSRNACFDADGDAADKHGISTTHSTKDVRVSTCERSEQSTAEAARSAFKVVASKAKRTAIQQH